VTATLATVAQRLSDFHKTHLQLRQDNLTSDDGHSPATILERLVNMFVP